MVFGVTLLLYFSISVLFRKASMILFMYSMHITFCVFTFLKSLIGSVLFYFYKLAPQIYVNYLYNKQKIKMFVYIGLFQGGGNGVCV